MSKTALSVKRGIHNSSALKTPVRHFLVQPATDPALLTLVINVHQPMAPPNTLDHSRHRSPALLPTGSNLDLRTTASKLWWDCALNWHLHYVFSGNADFVIWICEITMYSLDCDFTDSNDEVSTIMVRRRCLRLYHWVMNRKCRVRQAGVGGDYLERIYHWTWRWDRSTLLLSAIVLIGMKYEL